MKIHFLGTTGYHPNNRRHTACLMIPELGLVFDAGTGIFRARPLVETSTIDILMSHIHLDHSVGLTFLLDVLYEKEVDVCVHMDESKVDVLRDHLYHELLFPVKPDYEFKGLVNDQWQTLASGARYQAFVLNHPGGSHGFLLEHNAKTIAYVTDTTATADADYIDKIQNVDLLIHECYFPDGYEELAKLTGHSCLTPVAEVAAKSNAKSLVLVHINPLNESDQPLDLESIHSIYRDVQVAEDHLVIEV